MSDTTWPASGAGLLQTLDDAKISKFQIKTMFVSGMGFFTDAYDLFVIGIVVSLLKHSGACRPARVLTELGYLAGVGAATTRVGDDHERVLGETVPRPDGRPRVRHAGRRPCRRPAGRLVGSVSQRCAAAAPCPVVLVKRDGDGPG